MIGLIALISILITSTLSGILGMGGGFILAGILAFIMPLSAALMIHASAQLTSNSFRAFLQRRHIIRSIVGYYFLGLLTSLSLLLIFNARIDKDLFYLLLGITAISSHFIPQTLTLDITKPRFGFLAGFLVSTLHIFVGVAGPLLDVFFQRTNLNRFQIVATKATTQFLGHLMRIIFYLSIWSDNWESAEVSSLMLVAVVVFGVTGTVFGTKLLRMLNEKQFSAYTSTLLNTIGIVFIVRGVYGLYM